MSQVSKRLEVGNHKWRTLDTRLTSGTSAGTFACPAGPYRNEKGLAGTKNEIVRYFEPDLRKGSENRSEPKISLISFSRGSCPPLRLRLGLVQNERAYSWKIVYKVFYRIHFCRNEPSVP